MNSKIICIPFILLAIFRSNYGAVHECFFQITDQKNFQCIYLIASIITILRMKKTLKEEKANRIQCYKKVYPLALAQSLAEKKYFKEKTKCICVLSLFSILSLGTFIVYLEKYFSCTLTE